MTLEKQYDPAGREVAVNANLYSQSIPLRRLAYGTAAPAIGKIVEGVQYNYTEATCGVKDYGYGIAEPVDSITVETDFTYGGSQGELTEKSLAVRDLRYVGDTPSHIRIHSFKLSYGYDTWGKSLASGTHA